MKKPKIPQGWYRLRNGTSTKETDKWWSPIDDECAWKLNDILLPVGEGDTGEIVIRQRRTRRG